MEGGGLEGLIRRPSQPENPPTAPPQQTTLSGLLKEGPARKAPAPTLDQTFAAMHHMNAMLSHLEPLLNAKGVGKESIRPKFLDSLTSLMSERIISMPDAMKVLKQFPAEPQAQKLWLQNIVKQNEMARERVVEDFRMTAQQSEGGADPMAMVQGAKWSADNHGDHMKGLLDHYG